MDSSLSSESRVSGWTDYEQPSTAVVEAVADATGRDQTELKPLYQYVDGDDLDSLLRHSETPMTISFTYEGVQVDISAGGALTVRTD